ncbi:hypothetical protein JTE90_028994 [Oedothorax gibbosus]|uniref:TTF-type domain-containing protein n=1 Tax=Oedothorax gibbosus TaxID=931172 RepID=A0AAV6VH69_9ARAC|nr:hypothetical protein JTE90_028994 [Oedothorax gibbosus]
MQPEKNKDWLTLSASTHRVFCWVCKLFSNSTMSSLSTTGFYDWKHATERLHDHENSFLHREAVCNIIQRMVTSSRIDACIVEKQACETTRAVRENYEKIKEVLLEMSLNGNETTSTRHEASCLHKKMNKFETGLCVVMWDTILQRIDSVNKNLQSPSLDLSAVPD